jgi:hypothetical protein
LSVLDIFLGSWGFRTVSDLGAEGDVLLRGTSGFLWRHDGLMSMDRLDLQSGISDFEIRQFEIAVSCGLFDLIAKVKKVRFSEWLEWEARFS